MSALPLFDKVFSGRPEPTGPQLTPADLRDSGIQSALDHVLRIKKEYIDRCLSEISKMEHGLLFTSEHLRDVAGDPPEEARNCVAGILKRAASQGLIKNTGGEQIAKRVTVHAKKLSLWKRL